MATVTRNGTVLSVAHTKTGSTHVYSAKVKYDVPNPSPPPPTIEHIEEHKELDKDFYEDFRAALTGDKSVKVEYDEAPTNKPVSGVEIG